MSKSGSEVRMEKWSEEERKVRKEKEEETTAEAEKPSEAASSKVGRARLIDRDRQLLMALAEARLLSSRQVGYLFFPGRDESELSKRLGALEATGLIERTSARRLE